MKLLPVLPTNISLVQDAISKRNCDEANPPFHPTQQPFAEDGRAKAVRAAIHSRSKLQIIPAKVNKKPPDKSRGVSRGAVTLLYAFFPPTLCAGRIPQSVTNTPESS